MCAVKIVVDSTADIPAEERERLGIELIPLKVHFGEDTYLDGVNLGPDNFYDMLEKSRFCRRRRSPRPTTSSSSISAFWTRIRARRSSRSISARSSAARTSRR